MSEPTPLSAEELAHVRAFKPLDANDYAKAVRQWLGMTSYRKGNHPRYLATIDAQATEIAALKGALADVIPWLPGERRDRAFQGAIVAYNQSEGAGEETDRVNQLAAQREAVIKAARMLAGEGGSG